MLTVEVRVPDVVGTEDAEPLLLIELVPVFDELTDLLLLTDAVLLWVELKVLLELALILPVDVCVSLVVTDGVADLVSVPDGFIEGVAPNDSDDVGVTDEEGVLCAVPLNEEL